MQNKKITKIQKKFLHIANIYCIIIINRYYDLVITSGSDGMIKKISKAGRHVQLIEEIEKYPFITDDELSQKLGVSLPTIRLDRMELNIAEHRERIKNIAKNNVAKVRSIGEGDIVGEIVDIKPGESAVALLLTDESMVFSGSKVIRGSFIYSFAESAAIAVIDARAALIGVANIKYKSPAFLGEKLVAYAQVKSIRADRHIVWVFIKSNGKEMFRGKFLLTSI